MPAQFFNLPRAHNNFRIKSDDLLPKQQPSRINFLKSTDCYQQRFIKFPHVGVFHSFAELLHAALIESDKSISVFVPQPFLLYVGKRRYIPDCYYVKDGCRYVVEIKPRGKMQDALRKTLEYFFEHKEMQFKVVPNELIIQKETLALNWLKVIRTLLSVTGLETDHEEICILNRLFEEGILEIGDIIYTGDRYGQRNYEIALFRLAHQGKVNLALSAAKISYSTQVSICT